MTVSIKEVIPKAYFFCIRQCKSRILSESGGLILYPSSSTSNDYKTKSEDQPLDKQTKNTKLYKPKEGNHVISKNYRHL